MRALLSVAPPHVCLTWLLSPLAALNCACPCFVTPPPSPPGLACSQGRGAAGRVSASGTGGVVAAHR
jgi:hypothetical protein